jgi:cytochrome c oxidase subunit 2
MSKRAGWALLLPAALTGCNRVQTMLGGDGEHARQFINLFTLFGWVTAILYVIVIAALIAAMVRRGGRSQDGLEEGGESKEAAMRVTLIGWIAFITFGLVALSLASFFTDRQAAHAATPGKTLEIEITANQWWWDVKYDDPVPGNSVHTANELHLPIGVPAHIVLKSNDVIHSFWVPNLAGKEDLIPGRINDIELLPEKAGIYRGQCAEYCGAQHAHMALDVTVEPRAAFDAWRFRQLAPAPAPTTPLAIAGYNYVTTRECSVCHNISGTPASGQIAPDLTHLASRRSIAAGTYPMDRGHLYAWVADPQGAKPGNHMPYIGLEPQDLHATVAYLETLK